MIGAGFGSRISQMEIHRPNLGQLMVRNFIFAQALTLAVMLSMSTQAETLSEVPWAGDFRAFRQVPAIHNLSETQLAQLAPRVAEFEAGLKHAKAYFPNGAVLRGKIYVLADGHEEAAMALLMA